MTDNIFARSWPEPSSYPLLNDNSALLDWALYELLPEAKEGVGAIEPEVLAIDDPATDEYEAEMNEHEWLTEKQVALLEEWLDTTYITRESARLVIADWREMRQLLLQGLDQGYLTYEAIREMRKATADD
uniref:Uncharacterized protein n=1 Tax=viral metagenome TaxID=1070528 RepID=A0A6H1ZE75_9ZZZZ